MTSSCPVWDHDYNALLDSLATNPNAVELVRTDPVYAEAMLACYFPDALELLFEDSTLSDHRFSTIYGHSLLLTSRFQDAANQILSSTEQSPYSRRVLAHIGMCLYGYNKHPKLQQKIDAMIPNIGEFTIDEDSGALYWYNWCVRRHTDNSDLLYMLVEDGQGPHCLYEDLLQVVSGGSKSLLPKEIVMGLTRSAISQYPHSQVLKYYCLKSQSMYDSDVTPAEVDALKITRYLGTIVLSERQSSIKFFGRRRMYSYWRTSMRVRSVLYDALTENISFQKQFRSSFSRLLRARQNPLLLASARKASHRSLTECLEC